MAGAGTALSLLYYYYCSWGGRTSQQPVVRCLSIENTNRVVVQQNIQPQGGLNIRVPPGLPHRLRLGSRETTSVLRPTDLLEGRNPVQAGHLQGGVEQRQGRVKLLQQPDRRVLLREKDLDRPKELVHPRLCRGARAPFTP